MSTQYWLFKSEPETFSIDDLISLPKKTDRWEGIRNYQARNFLRDDVQKGDMVFFYHSNCKVPAIVGIMQVTKEAYPDDTALDPKSKYYDPKATPDNPRWFMVDVKHKQKFKHPIPLTTLKANPKLKELPLVKKGNRLSIIPVTPKHWDVIMNMVDA